MRSSLDVCGRYILRHFDILTTESILACALYDSISSTHDLKTTNGGCDRKRRTKKLGDVVVVHAPPIYGFGLGSLVLVGWRLRESVVRMSSREIAWTNIA